MHFLRGKYRPRVDTINFEEDGRIGSLLLPAGTYRAETHRDKHGRVTTIEDGNVQHALVRPDPLRAEIRMKQADLRTHIADIINAIKEAARS